MKSLRESILDKDITTNIDDKVSAVINDIPSIDMTFDDFINKKLDQSTITKFLKSCFADKYKLKHTLKFKDGWLHMFLYNNVMFSELKFVLSKYVSNPTDSEWRKYGIGVDENYDERDSQKRKIQYLYGSIVEYGDKLKENIIK